MKYALIIFLSLLSLTACGFHPVYGVNKYTPVGVESKLAQTSIGNIPDREGQYLRNALIDRFYREGRPDDPVYSLNVSPLEETKTDLDITTTSDATRGQLRIATTITLNHRATGEKVLQRNLSAYTSYNIIASEFATRVSEDNARLNAINDLARQIETQLTLYFKRDL